MSLSSGVPSLFCIAELIAWGAHGLETKTIDADLMVESIVYRESPEDVTDMEIIVQFTSGVEPEVEFFHNDGLGGKVVLDQIMEYSNRRGTVSTQYPAGSTEGMGLKIGYFGVHFFSFVLFLPDDSPGFNKTFNARLSTVTPAYEFSYVRGTDDSFAVTATVPKNLSSGYTFMKLDTPGGYRVDVDACYVDQDTQAVKSSMQRLDSFSSTSNFLEVDKTFTDDDATVTLTFDTTQEDISGYFQIKAFWTDKDSYVQFSELDEPMPMSWVSEQILFNVHDNTTPGPFPAGYGYIMTDDEESCHENTTCFVFCYGYASGIVEADILKNEDGGLTRIEDVKVIYTNDNMAYFFAHLYGSDDTAGDYVCHIKSRENITAQRTMAVTVLKWTD